MSVSVQDLYHDNWKLAPLLNILIGVEINRRHEMVTIDRFNESHPIAELPVYPERFAENAKTKREDRIKRGRKYLNLFGPSGTHRMYSGFLSSHLSKPHLKQGHKHVRS